jgi:spore coat polysaccharide biosynthesis protein SpsF (cytidylyltransferase family)
MPEAFHTRLIPLPAVLEHTDLRFTLETEKDLDRALMILEATGEDCDYRDLVPLASHFDADSDRVF